MAKRQGENHNKRTSESEARRLLSDPPNNDFIAALRRVLRTHRRGGWLTINQVAELAGVSVRTLQRKLAAEGRIYSELVDEIRAERAVDLLKNTDVSLVEIAKEVGYSTPSNFARAFERSTGQSPTEFRRGT
jgi:AraC-like DNA-binding protein